VRAWVQQAWRRESIAEQLEMETVSYVDNMPVPVLVLIADGVTFFGLGVEPPN
jgi:hypothetical protein